jgi:uncharacterized membrane protein
MSESHETIHSDTENVFCLPTLAAATLTLVSTQSPMLTLLAVIVTPVVITIIGLCLVGYALKDGIE